MVQISDSKLHIAMFPWLAIGHIIPYAQLSNELANRGHRVSFFVPKKGLLKLGNLDLYSNLVKFYTVKVPGVEGLPAGAETASDIDFSAKDALARAFDAMADEVGSLVRALKPDVVFFDLAHWITDLAREVGFKTVCYHVVCGSILAIGVVPSRHFPKDRPVTDDEMMELPEGYPSDTIVLRGKEVQTMSFLYSSYGDITFDVRMTIAFQNCDSIGIRTVSELEGPMCDYMAREYGKQVILSGPVLPETPKTDVDEKWDAWLNKYEAKTVIYCAFGSQNTMSKEQFQELVLGFEMTGLPFFVAVSKPRGTDSIEEALPEGFQHRVGDRGVVHGGWVPQAQFLNHPSVGCFVSHCGFGSMWESLLSECQIVLVPWLGDQILNARLLADEIKVGVEVKRDENAWFCKEDLCRAVQSVMDEDGEVGRMTKENHSKWRKTLGRPGFMSEYIDDFVEKLYQL